MHEFSIAENIVDIISDNSSEQNERVFVVNLGQFSGVHKDPIIFYLDLIFEERNMKAVKYEINEIPGKCKCDCGVEYKANQIFEGCPQCHGFKRDVIEGMDCTVEFREK